MITDLDGLASGQLNLTGYTDKPVINGSLNLQKASLRVDYLQTIYSFTNEIQVRDNSILFNDFEIFDEEGNRSVVQGTINNSYFRDFRLDISLRAENFNFMENES